MNDSISKTTAPYTNKTEKSRIKSDMLSKIEKTEKLEKVWDSGFLWEELKYIENLNLNKKDIDKELCNEFENYESTKLLEMINNRISYEPIFLRGLIIIVDFNETISERNTVFSPNKLDYLKEKILELGKQFFERNFLSSISIIGVSDYTAKSLIISCYDYVSFVKEMNEFWPKSGYGSGSFSFYNSLYVGIINF